MGYQYNYGALMGATATDTGTNFQPISSVANTADLNNQLEGLLDQKGIDASSDAGQAIIQSAIQSATDSGTGTIGAMQTVASVTEQDVAAEAGNLWGGSGITQGSSFLQAIAEGQHLDADSELSQALGTEFTDLDRAAQIDYLYEHGFGRAEEDVSGSQWWDDTGFSIGKIAESFLQSEEGQIKDIYSEYYNRDTDEEGLGYWMNWNPDGSDDHNLTNITNVDGRNILLESITTRDEQWVQEESVIRDALSSIAGLHSTDEQRDADEALNIDGVAGADIYVSADQNMVQSMMDQLDTAGATMDDVLNAINYIADAQTAAAHMGDYSDYTDPVTGEVTSSTDIHRILSGGELFPSGQNEDGSFVDADGNPWTQPSLDGADYTPSSTTTTHDDGTQTTSYSNVWSLLKDWTQTYTPDDIIDVFERPNEPGPGTGENDDIVVTNVDTDPMPPLDSDVGPHEGYGQSKATFDSAAAGVAANIPEGSIRSADQSAVGASAEGVRLRRSKKFKSGQSALGTKQFGRQLQIQSLNI